MSRNSRFLAQKMALRDTFWPDGPSVVYDRDEEKGFAQLARITPFVIIAMNDKAVCHGKTPGSVYLELLCRDMGTGLVEIRNEREHAFAAGYAYRLRKRPRREDLAGTPSCA